MENSKLSDVKGKELVAAGHAFAKAIGMDTPLIEVAKLVSELATRLDCALVRGDAHKQDVMTWEKAMMAAIGEDGVGCVVRAIAALKADRDALAAAHSELRESMAAIHNTIRLDGVNTSLGALLSASKRAHEASVPTDAHLNSVRAEGVEAFAHQQRVIADATPAAAFQRDRRFAAGLAEDFAAQLRAGKESM